MFKDNGVSFQYNRGKCNAGAACAVGVVSINRNADLKRLVAHRMVPLSRRFSIPLLDVGIVETEREQRFLYVEFRLYRGLFRSTLLLQLCRKTAC